MRRLPTVLVLALAALLLFPAGTSVAPVPQDDAGTGADAPDAPGAGAPIEPGIVYSGRLAEDDFHDWYAFEAPAGAIVEARAQGAYGCFEIAGADGVALAHGCARGPYVEAQPLLATIPTSGAWYVHYENVPLDAYFFSIGIDAPAPSPVAGPAPPSIDVESEQNDAGSGGDAPNTLSDDLRIESGVVYAGFLDGVSEDSDWYAFDGAAGDVVEARVRGTVDCYYIHRPDGSELDFNCSVIGLDTAIDVSLLVTLDATGTHYLQVTYFDPHDYRFAIGVNEPAPAVLLPYPTPLDGAARAFWPAPPASTWLDAADTGAPVDLVVQGEPMRVRVWDNGELVAPFVTLPEDAAGVRTLAGESAGATARFTMFADGSYVGHVFHPRLGMVTLETRPDGAATAYTERVARSGVGQAFDDETAFPRAVDVGGCLRPVPARLANPLGLALGWPERTFDVAYAVDDDFVAIHGSAWAAQALAYANAIDGFYESQIGMRVRVADLHAHTAGAIEGADTSALLSSSAGHYAGHHATLARENTHLFSGVPLSGVVGQASCIGGAGDPELAYTVGLAVPEDPLLFFGLTWFNDQTIKIASHEMGHILSAHHHYASCVVERAPEYDPFETLDLCTLMINDIGLASMQFSTVNKLTVRGWAEHADL